MMRNMNLPEKKVTATEIKNRFGDYLGEVVRTRKPLVIERHGKPIAILISLEGWKIEIEKERPYVHPWVRQHEKLIEQIKKNHPDSKPFSAVELVRQIRREREEDLS